MANNRKSPFNPWLTLLLVLFGLNLAIEMAKNTVNLFSGVSQKTFNSEAKQYLLSINRAQQAYFAENTVFAKEVNDLNIGIKTQTDRFNYSIALTKTAAFSYAIPRPDASRTVSFGLLQWKQKIELKAYVGGVFSVPAIPGTPKTDRPQLTTVFIVCEANSSGTNLPSNPVFQNGVPVCGSNTVQISISK
jgi:type IV pilus assembly protein PilA